MTRGQWCIAVSRACLKKEGLAFLALLVSLGGAAVISLMLLGNLFYLREAQATTEIFYLSCGMLLLIGIVLMSSHRLLGSTLAIKAEILAAKLSINQGGNEP